MSQIPSPAEELRLLDTELRQLDSRRAMLLNRRVWLVHTLQSAPVWTAPLAPPAFPARRPEATAPGVQNVLLLLGGILLTIAAAAFTLVGWGHLGIAGRSLVLGAVTLAALGAPVFLLRRGLRATAEALAGLGLALTVLDAYALYAVALPRTDGVAYSALASTALAAVWTAYGLAVGATGPRGAAPNPGADRETGAAGNTGANTGTGVGTGAGPEAATVAVRPSLWLPLPAAVVAAQLPLLLWAVAAAAGACTVTAALLVTAAFDAALALRVSLQPVRVVAAAWAYGMGGCGTFAAGWLSLTAAGPSAAARAAALLLFSASIALAAAWRVPKPGLATAAATAGGLICVVAFGGVLRTSLPGEWTVPGHLACGIALLALARTGLPAPVRRGVALASGCVGALSVAWALPVVLVTLLGPVGLAGSVWSGAPASARDAVTAVLPWPSDSATAPLVLALVAAVLVVAVRTAAWRAHAVVCALTLAWATVFVLPATLELPYAAGLSVQGITLVALLGYARRTYPSVTAPVPALLTSLSLAFLALASETATLTVLAALAVLFAAAAVRPARRPGLGPFAAPASLGYATALACAAGASLGLRPEHTALLVLVVPVVAALLAARVEDGPTTVSIEVTGALAGLLAVGLAVAEPAVLATVLALCAVIAAGTAVRQDRRSAGYAAAALFVLAAWVRLAAWGVGSPEAYTLPVTVPALLVGAFRRRADTTVSSWTAYGPGLSVTLVPSLFAVWGDAHWLRPLLLGSAALAVTLLGARHRLQAPLVLGGSVLVLDALHELAPYIIQLVNALPRWTPPALAGLLLLGLGATYEQRIRDARRVREVLGRMD
ncbi:SCO7613 C-terminal domain-containing membrane protein [Streptomyces sp. NPDC091209]|uniref:SCO7613 C-terminal domain-containing membrane protein n=1 Tax=Streptomyces sp. NPDC091209 TaxID=3365974 RepID=UPI003811F961